MSRLASAFASLFVFGLLAATPACTVQLGSKSEGENGRAELAYSDSCMFGCAVDHPMLAGSTVRVRVSGVSEVYAVSENTSVLSVDTEQTYQCCTSSGSCTSTTKYDSCNGRKELTQTLVIYAHADGDARVQFVGAGGPVDAFTFEVREPASASLHVGNEGDASVDAVTIYRDGGTPLKVDLLDDLGRRIEAPDGVHLESADKSVASFKDSSWFGADPDGLQSYDVTSNWFESPTLLGRRAGHTTLRVMTRGFERDFPVEVK